MQVAVNPSNDNRFDFKKAGKDKDGDGTVHGKSSRVPAVKSYMDTRNKIGDLLGGQHAQMPTHDDVQDYIIKTLKDSPYLVAFQSTR